MLQSEKILLFNILNYLSRNSQNRIWSFTTNAGGNFNTRFALLVYELTTRNSKNIKITYKQKDLCLQDMYMDRREAYLPCLKQ